MTGREKLTEKEAELLTRIRHSSKVDSEGKKFEGTRTYTLIVLWEHRLKDLLGARTNPRGLDEQKIRTFFPHALMKFTELGSYQRQPALRIQYLTLQDAIADRQNAAARLADQFIDPPSVSFLRLGTLMDGALEYHEVPYKVELHIRVDAILYKPNPHTTRPKRKRDWQEQEKLQGEIFVILKGIVEALGRQAPHTRTAAHMIEKTAGSYTGVSRLTLTIFPHRETDVIPIASALREKAVPRISELLQYSPRGIDISCKGLPPICRLCTTPGHIFGQCKLPCIKMRTAPFRLIRPALKAEITDRLKALVATNGNHLPALPEVWKSSSWTFLFFQDRDAREQALQTIADYDLLQKWGLDASLISLHNGLPSSCNYCGADKVNGQTTCDGKCKGKPSNLKPMECGVDGHLPTTPKPTGSQWSTPATAKAPTTSASPQHSQTSNPLPQS